MRLPPKKKKASEEEISDVFNGEKGRRRRRKADLQKERERERDTLPNADRKNGLPPAHASSQHSGKGVHMRLMAPKGKFNDIGELVKK